jgi:hypothetical protein
MVSCDHPYVAQDIEEVLVHVVVCSRVRCLSSSVGAYGAEGLLRQTPSSQSILCGTARRVDAVRVPVREEVDGPAWAVVGEVDMSLAHDGGVHQGGGGSNEVCAPGVGGHTDYETDMVITKVDDVVKVEVGVAQVQDGMMKSMAT